MSENIDRKLCSSKSGITKPSKIREFFRNIFEQIFEVEHRKPRERQVGICAAAYNCVSNGTYPCDEQCYDNILPGIANANPFGYGKRDRDDAAARLEAVAKQNNSEGVV